MALSTLPWRLGRALLGDAGPAASGRQQPCLLPPGSRACAAALQQGAAAGVAYQQAQPGSTPRVSTKVLVIVMVVCTVVALVAVAGALWRLNRWRRRGAAEARRLARLRRQLEKEAEEGAAIREVVIPVIVVGPDAAALHVAFDEAYVAKRAAQQAQQPAGAAAGSACTCASSPDGSAHGSASCSLHPEEQQPAAAPGGSSADGSSSHVENASSAAPSADPAAGGGPQSLVQRILCPASCSVLSVADVAALRP